MAAAVAVAGLVLARETRAQLSGELGAHDPSTLVKEGSTYYYFATGPGIVSRSSANKVDWSAGSSVFGAPPSWTNQAVPGFGGVFWAPDVVYRNGLYHLYYSVSTFGSQDSAIGLATSPTLNPAAPNYGWTDRGAVVQSQVGSPYNTIDASVLNDPGTGRMWMTFGSYWGGIYVTELDPATGKRKAGSPDTHIASNSSIEASALIKRGSYYYLFVNWGSCCAGVDSTYNIRVGRSTSPTGPFLDKNGVDMADGGGSLFLDDDGRYFGPGHFGYFSEGGQDYFGYHYYNGDADGAATYGLRNLYWTTDAWPSYAAVNPDWTGASSSNWSATGNWSGATVPNGAGHVATFRANTPGRYTVVLDGGGGKTVATLNFRSANSFTIGSNSGNTLTLDATVPGDAATINVADGNHTIAAPIVALDNLGVNVTPASRTLVLSGTVSAPMLSKYGHGRLTLGGANTYAGSVFVKQGTLDVTGSVTAGRFVSVGQFGDDGTLVVRGAGRFTANSDLNIGDTGDASTPATGALDLRDSANITVNSGGGFFVGSGFFADTRAVGTVNQSGGTLTVNGGFDGAFVIGGRNSALGVGTYNLSGGTVNANTNVRVGGRGTGTVNQTGGTFNVAGHVAVGRFQGSTGAWTVSGGTLDHTNSTTRLIVGEGGTGTLTVSGSGRVTTTGSLHLGQDATGAGTVNLDTGGMITTPLVHRGSGAATFNFNGGTLRSGASNATFLQGLTTARVKAGGARIDTQGFDVTVAQPLLHDQALGAARDGGLTKLGTGTLALAGESTYTGTTTVSAGTLRVDGAVASPVSVQGGTLAGNGQVRSTVTSGAAVAPGAGGPGRLSVTNFYQQTVSGRLRVEIAGTTPGTGHDQLTVGATALLAGTLELSLAGGYLPPLGQTFTALSATSRSGIFDSVAGVAAPAAADLSFAVTYSPTSVLVTAALPGDINLDQLVGPGDFNLLASNFGRGGQSWATGDLDGDGLVGPGDFNVLASNFGRSGAGLSAGLTDADWTALDTFATANVPEPAAAGLALAFAGWPLLLRRKR